MFGYMVCNDVSSRGLAQGEHPTQGATFDKGLDTFSPCGPHLTLQEDVPASVVPLKAGDRVEITIERLGTLRNRVVADGSQRRSQ